MSPQIEIGFDPAFAGGELVVVERHPDGRILILDEVADIRRAAAPREQILEDVQRLAERVWADRTLQGLTRVVEAGYADPARLATNIDQGFARKALKVLPYTPPPAGNRRARRAEIAQRRRELRGHIARHRMARRP